MILENSVKFSCLSDILVTSVIKFLMLLITDELIICKFARDKLDIIANQKCQIWYNSLV